MKQNTPEWLELRRTKIGASDAAAILGISPYDTPYSLWEKKVLGKEQEMNGGMRRGQEMEEMARLNFESVTGLFMQPHVRIHDTRTWQMASLDGINFEGTMILEIKCPNKEVHALAKKGTIPDYYMAQIQHQLSVTEAEKAYYFSFDGSDGIIVEILPDDKFIAKMLEKEEKFYDLMVRQEAPELTERDYVRYDKPSILELAEEYEEAKTQADIHYMAAEKCKEDLIKAVGERNSLIGKIKLTKSICKGQVDYKLIPELVGVNLEPYRKSPCQKWRISVME